MKAIFLDFDGVITMPPKWTLNLNKIKLIKKIVDETDAKIIISSSWRANTIENTIEKNFNTRIPHDDIIIWFIKNLYDVTPYVCDINYVGQGRGGEIQTYLLNHPEVENYVIIDDDSDMLNTQLYHFIQTNFEDGITETEVNRAIKILNKKYIQNLIALNFTLRYEYRKYCEGLPNKWDEIITYNDTCRDYNNR